MQRTMWRPKGCRTILAFLLTATPAAGSAQAAAQATLAVATETGFAAATALLYPPDIYAGRDPDGVPYYVERPFSLDERRLLREHFGIEEPGQLYLSDSGPGAYLMYDTERDPGVGRLVRTYRMGAASIRRPGETWEQLERRLRTMRPGDFPAAVRRPNASLASLDPRRAPPSSGCCVRPGGPDTGCGSWRRTGPPSARRICGSGFEPAAARPAQTPARFCRPRPG